MRIKAKAPIIIIGFIVAIFFSLIAIAAIDAPHNASNNISCGSCHGEALLDSPFWGGSYDPANIDDTVYNKLCLNCHKASSVPYTDTNAPLEKTHSSLNTSNKYSDWTRECRTCHDPHYQKQKNYKPTESGNLYLATGTITLCVYNPPVPPAVVGTSTLTYSAITYKSGWEWNPAINTKLVAKTSDDRRTILFPNVSKLGYNYPIIAVDSGLKTITVKGDATAYLYPPTKFAAMYGQYIKDNMDISADGSGVNKAVKFFDQVGTKSFADGDTTYNGVCEVCHTQTTYHRNDASGDHIHFAATNCVSCHPHTEGFKGGGGPCDGCHYGGAGGAYPATGSHAMHFGGAVSDAAYGDTKITKDFNSYSTVYIFNCGNCHPLDAGMHNNGTVNVEFYNASAPAGSLKAMNPPSASYDSGTKTCSNVSCHSYNEFTTSCSSGACNIPFRIVPYQPCQYSSEPLNLVVTRYYKTPVWGGASLTCSGCHQNPPRSTWATGSNGLRNDGGLGNTHSWIDDYSEELGHNFNATYYGAGDRCFPPLSCKWCHNDTAKVANTWSRANWVATLGNVPIDNHSTHVSGTPDIAFDTAAPLPYKTTPGCYAVSYPLDTFTLAGASYNPATKTCSNVKCHAPRSHLGDPYSPGESSVKWGVAYRFWRSGECVRCHGTISTDSCPRAADSAGPSTGSVSINSGAASTNSLIVTLTLTCADSISCCAQMKLSNDNANWSAPEPFATSPVPCSSAGTLTPKAWTLSSGPTGTRTVYVKFRDNAGNWSGVYQDDILYSP